MFIFRSLFDLSQLFHQTQISYGTSPKENREEESQGPDFTVTPRLQEAFVRFLEYHPAKRLSVNLRSWLLEFLMYDGSAEAEYLYHLVTDLSGLFDLLDVVQEEWKGATQE